MSLTASQQMQIVTYLGWPAKTLIVGSTNYDQTVATRLTLLDAASEPLVIQYITDIVDVKAKYVACRARMLVKKVGDIEINSGEHESLGRELRRLLRELSQLLDIPLLAKGASRNLSVGV